MAKRDIKDNSDLLATKEPPQPKSGVTDADLEKPDGLVLRKDRILCKRLVPVFLRGGSNISMPQNIKPKAGLFVVCEAAEVAEFGVVKQGSVLVLPHYAGFPLAFHDTLFFFVSHSDIHAVFDAESEEAIELREICNVLNGEE